VTTGVCALLLAAAGAVRAQEAPPPTQAAADQAPVPPQTSTPEYQVGPGDLLSITVTGLKEFAPSTRVSNSGKLHLPYLGVLRVNEMTVSQLEAQVAELLRQNGLVKEPWVSVKVVQYRAQPVYALGEVMAPGQFVIKDEMYLIDLLTLAGGLNEVATPIGHLYRRRAGAEDLPPGEVATDEAIPIDFQALNEGRRPDLNLKLRGGDVLYVPQRRKDFYYVVGDVMSAGAFELKSDAPTVLVTRALAMAGGPGRTAKANKGILVRQSPEGAREEIPVDFNAILHGKKPDFPVAANDIIFVPGSQAKTLALGLLGALPMVVVQTGASTVR
jgi:polysaccharide export outer membrane protein